MKLGFEVTRTISKHPTGINRYARKLIDAVAAEAGGTQIELFYKLPKLARRKYWLRFDGIRSRVRFGGFWPATGFPDVVHGLDGYVPAWKNVKKVVTIHDLFPLIEGHDSPPGFADMIRTGYSEAIAVADRVVTVSENTRRDVIEHFQVEESKVVTVYPGHGLGNITGATNTKRETPVSNSRNYLLFLGSVSGRKNTERIVRAYAESKASKEFDLLMIGSVAYKGESTLEAIAELGLEERVKICGYVADSEMASVFRKASGLVFPTLYEGFGFPVLEAMLLDVPVLTSNIGSTVEVAGGNALLVDPYDIDSIAAGIDRLLEEGSVDLAAAKEHALGFTWEKCASELLSIYRGLVEAKKETAD